MVHVDSGLWCMALSLVLVVVDAVDVDDANVVVPILHAVGTSAASQDPVALSIDQGSLLA